MKKQTIIVAFHTANKGNRLNHAQVFWLVKKLTAVLGGVTLTEHAGGYTRQDNGQADVEYSYTLEFFGVSRAAVKAVGQDLAAANGQESYILNGKFVNTVY